MAKKHQIEGSNLRIYGSSGGLYEGGLLKICSSRLGAYSGGGAFSRGEQFEDLRYLAFRCIHKNHFFVCTVDLITYIDLISKFRRLKLCGRFIPRFNIFSEYTEINR